MDTQRQQLLEQLKKSEKGVNSYFATYSMNIKQAPTRIRELKDLGYNIISKPNKDRSVNWILSDTLVNKPVEQPKSKLIPVFKNNTAYMVTQEEYERMKPEQQSLI